jgi:hypothetical protein
MNNLKKESSIAMKEFDFAWNEYFKDKPRPKDDEEDKKQQEEFHHWYNYIRKQRDTGKTPAEMYKEIYGEEPPKDSFDNSKPSRVMNFEWDEDYSEEEFDDEDYTNLEELDEAQKEAVIIANKIFDKSWKNMKKEIGGVSKREACKYSFILGFLGYLRVMDKKAELIREEMEDMTEEDFKRMVEEFKDYEDNRKK